MTGLPGNNYVAFRQAEQDLRAAGYRIHNPIRSDRRADSPRLNPGSWEDWMRNGINQLIRADGIALLPGWAGSKGAALELRVSGELRMQAGSVEDWIRAAHDAEPVIVPVAGPTA